MGTGVSFDQDDRESYCLVRNSRFTLLVKDFRLTLRSSVWFGPSLFFSFLSDIEISSVTLSFVGFSFCCCLL